MYHHKKEDHIDDQIKKACKQQHLKHMYSKILIPEKNVIRTTLETDTDTTASSP